MYLLRQQLLIHINPILLALGAVVGTTSYFILPTELSVKPIAGILIFSIILLWKNFKPAVFAFGASAFFLISAAQTNYIYQHKYKGEIPAHTIWIAGTIIETRSYPKRTYFTLENTKLYIKDNPILAKIKLSLATSRVTEGMVIGHGIAAQAVLQKPKPPSFKGEYDSQFHSFFQKIAAKGYVRGEVYSTYIPSKLSMWGEINKIRYKLANKITAQASPLATALITGLRGGIPKDIREAFKKSGLAHLLAISGLHLGMVGGIIFFTLRYLMACYPMVALNYNTKKIAALAGLGVTAGYMLLAGATIPTVRAFTMVALLFIAVLLDKFRIAIRLWSIAVLIVLAIWPYSVVTASFQMSFIAALALILWVTASEKIDEIAPKRLTYVKGIIIASLVAGLATLPLAAWHFNMVSFTGFFLNLIAIPLMGFWILPAAILALILMPLGLDYAPFQAMQYGLNLLVDLALWGSETSLAGWVVSPYIWPWLGIISCLGIWAVVSRRFKTAWLSVVSMGVLLLVWPQKPVADIILLNHGKAIVMCPEISKCSIVKRDKTSKRTAKNFFKFYNLKETKMPSNCQVESCIYRLKNQNILITSNPPSAEDCRLSTLIISPYEAKNCPVITSKSNASMFINLNKNNYISESYNAGISRLWEG